MPALTLTASRIAARVAAHEQARTARSDLDVARARLADAVDADGPGRVVALELALLAIDRAIVAAQG